MTRSILLVPLLLSSIFDYTIAVRWSNGNAPKGNLTIEAVKGTSLHGSNRTLCCPLTWPSLATFNVGNFIAHIATVQSTPGDKWPLTAFDMLLALLFPTSGLMRGLNAIVRNFSSSFFARKVIARIFNIKRWRKDETSLERACKAGALCVVVRDANWRPKPGQVDIPAVLSSVISNADLKQPLNTELPDIESAQLVRYSSEDDDTVSALHVLAEEASDSGPANLRPKGISELFNSLMICDSYIARNNPDHISPNMASGKWRHLVDSFRHFMGSKHCRSYSQSCSWNLQAAYWILILNLTPGYYRTSWNKLHWRWKPRMRNRCFVQHSENLGINLSTTCSNVYALASPR